MSVVSSIISSIIFYIILIVASIVQVVLQCIDVHSAEYPFAKTDSAASKEEKQSAEPYIYGLSEDDRLTVDPIERDAANNDESNITENKDIKK